MNPDLNLDPSRGSEWLNKHVWARSKIGGRRTGQIFMILVFVFLSVIYCFLVFTFMTLAKLKGICPAMFGWKIN